jgi:hypothetical protein
MNQQDGRKHDSGKSRLDLVVPGWLWEVGQVLRHGGQKYGEYNWKLVERARYLAAIGRHLLALMAGQVYDPETGFHHGALIACSAMFLWWGDEGDTLPARTCQCPVCTGGQHANS